MPDRRPQILIAGAGAAGLWCSLRLIERGFPGSHLTLVEPDAKTADDHTWSYWAQDEVVPPALVAATFGQVELATDGRRAAYPTAPYRYETVRSSAFYAYAKTVLAKAGATWVKGSVEAVTTLADARVEVLGEYEEKSFYKTADYVLDSRLPHVDVNDARYNSTLQHFGGYFLRFERACLDTDVVTFMDFVELDGETGFFYVLPISATEALVELAIFSKEVWERRQYDEALEAYVARRYDGVAYELTEREYGVIPMTDQPLWEESTSRVWKIGTAAGWVQPSSGYAFTRTASYADEVAASLLSARPRPWRPSALQQVFNSTMLRYVIDYPERAGEVFYELFRRNGAPTTFKFLDEGAAPLETLRLMWRTPRTAFAKRAIREVGLRLVGAK